MNHLGFQNDSLAQNIFLSALNSNSLTVLSFTGGSVSKSILGLSFPQWKIIFSWPYLHPPLLIKVWRILKFSIWMTTCSWVFDPGFGEVGPWVGPKDPIRTATQSPESTTEEKKSLYAQCWSNAKMESYGLWNIFL